MGNIAFLRARARLLGTIYLVLLALMLIGGPGEGIINSAVAQGQLTDADLSGTPTTSPPTLQQTLTGVTVEQYGLFETDVPVQGTFENPGNPSEIEVTARFLSPSGARFAVPAFWMQPQQITCENGCQTELFKPVGNSVWRVRFSPNTPGQWAYNVESRDATTIRVVAQGMFAVTPATRPGFIRVAANQRYFAYDNGKAYFPVGPNLGWSWDGARNTRGYVEWLDRLAEVGANYGRLYIDVPWFIGLGWRAPIDSVLSIQQDAHRLDAILQAAEKKGIALQLVLVWHQGWVASSGLPVNPPTKPERPNTQVDWFSNPHNLRRGGPFNTAAQFFATEQGRTMLKHRLRYIVARWGYSSSVFSWEVIDQLDKLVPGNPEITVSWLTEMVSYLREIDAYGHLITAGVRDMAQASLLDSIRLDFGELRYYQRRPIEESGDQVLGVLNLIAPLLSKTNRPLIINEFSLNPWFEPAADDPAGVHIRTTMWTAALSGAASTGAPWWWDTYIFPQNLDDIFGPLVAFTKDIPWNSANLRPVEVSFTSSGAIQYQPLLVTGYNTTLGSTTPPGIVFRLAPDGVSPPLSAASAFLYGVTYNREGSRPQQYIVTAPTDTRFTVNVARTSDRASARLVIIIDGKTVGEMSLSLKNPPASLTVPISAGEHTVVLDNLGDDYLQLESITIEAYIPPLRTLALADRDAGILLAVIQHRDYTWQNAASGVQPRPISGEVRISAMPPGMYQIELWDPFTGNVVGQESVTIEGKVPGELRITLLPVSKMLAVRAVRIAEPANVPTATLTLTPTPRIVPSSTPSSTASPTRQNTTSP